MTIEEIKQKKRQGDYVLAGEMLGLTKYNVKVTLNRPGAKRHQKVKEALIKIIRQREELLKQQ